MAKPKSQPTTGDGRTPRQKPNQAQTNLGAPRPVSRLRWPIWLGGHHRKDS